MFSPESEDCEAALAATRVRVAPAPMIHTKRIAQR
jgi:hypothetical protein